MNTMTYTLPAHWASVLVNGDYSGLSDEDEVELSRWMDWHAPGHLLDVGSAAFFAWRHDASPAVAACDCLEYTFVSEPDVRETMRVWKPEHDEMLGFARFLGGTWGIVAMIVVALLAFYLLWQTGPAECRTSATEVPRHCVD